MFHFEKFPIIFTNVNYIQIIVFIKISKYSERFTLYYNFIVFIYFII